jgi:hypothetical protein
MTHIDDNYLSPMRHLPLLLSLFYCTCVPAQNSYKLISDLNYRPDSTDANIK